ncbi:MAG TPA: DUF1839 family protein, partial [Bryobacteraceae bacterium]|nr:DUF1839 family protein [Bryobacteraceae bacterium]
GEELRREAIESLRRQLAYMPKRNTWTAIGASLEEDLTALLAGSDENYHAYAFATVRQCGAAFETARSFVEWCDPSPEGHSATAAAALGRQVNGAKMLLFKLARRRAFNPAPAIAELAGDWESSIDALDRMALTVELNAV